MAMWSDNETDRDLLNFQYVANIAAEMIAQANGRPLSMGISGSWGVGKSSMMKLLRRSLGERTGSSFLFVEFNAWLYQGYDDTRAALMEVIASAMVEYATANGTVVGNALEKAKGLLSRVNWFRLGAVGAASLAGMAFGLPPVGLLAEGMNVVKRLTDGSISQGDVDATVDAAGKAVKATTGLLRDKPEERASPPRAIQEFRDDLRDTLAEMGVTLVVLIDDLDRCLPATAIATLEAMRLFLFMEHTAFVIAADEKMIRASVRVHFKDVALDDDLVTNYFDKLIQVPIRVPPLGTQDVRAYLMSLFIENSSLPQADKDHLRAEMSTRLGQTWTGKRVDREFVSGLLATWPTDLLAQLDLADRIAPLLIRASQIAGNPRLIKRFLNTLSIRMSIARAQGVNVDEAALAKMLLFERNGTEKAYSKLLDAVNESEEGRPAILKEMELALTTGSGEGVRFEPEWDNEFGREWLSLPPMLHDMDLRGIAYVSRENLPIITATDRLSSDGAKALELLLALTSGVNRSVVAAVSALPAHETTQITERLLSRAKAATSWGTPPILWGLLTASEAPGEHVQRIARFLGAVPSSQITAPIVPLLADRPWAKDVLRSWASRDDVSSPVKRAIASASSKEGR